MKDILVTTPINDSKSAAQEAINCLQANGGYYFRSMKINPIDLAVGSKIFYVDNGYIRGFAVVDSIQNGSIICSTTGKRFNNYLFFMRADSWKWIEPIAYKGFQGFRYFEKQYKVIGNWRDPMPGISSGEFTGLSSKPESNL